MCVCGEIGYAQTTSGRQSATGLSNALTAFDLLKHGSSPSETEQPHMQGVRFRIGFSNASGNLTA